MNNFCLLHLWGHLSLSFAPRPLYSLKALNMGKQIPPWGTSRLSMFENKINNILSISKLEGPPEGKQIKVPTFTSIIVCSLQSTLSDLDIPITLLKHTNSKNFDGSSIKMTHKQNNIIIIIHNTFRFLSPPSSKCLHLLIGNCFLILHSVHSILNTIFFVVFAYNTMIN